jgi:polyhydroxyalkanoate synthesis regulator phasin
MPFTVQDFPDLLRLLEEHPEWQAELRRHVLTEELLELPALVRRLTEAQARTDEQLAILTARVDALTEQGVVLTARVDALTVRVDDLTVRLDALTARVDDLTSRVDALTARVDALTEQVAGLTEQVAGLTEQVGRLVARMDVLTSRVDANTGELLEFRYERRAGAYFSPMARRIRVLNHSALADLLDDALDAGRITESERREVLRSDLVVMGQRRTDREPVYLVVEISMGIGIDDIQRAIVRAGIMAQLGRPAIPVVAGQRIDPEPAELAGARGVWQVLDGHIVEPQVVA